MAEPNDENVVSAHEISWDLQKFLCTYVDNIAVACKVDRENCGIVNDYVCNSPSEAAMRIPPLDDTPWPEGIILFHGAFCVTTQEAFNTVLRDTVARLKCEAKDGEIDVLLAIDSYGGEVSRFASTVCRVR